MIEKKPDEIREEIHYIQNDMNETIDTLEEKLSKEALINEAKNKASNIKTEMKAKARGKVTEISSKMRNKAGSKYESSKENLKHQTQNTYDQVRSKFRRLSDGVNRHPILLSGVGFAFGTILGSLIPSTQKEDELINAAKEKIKSEGKSRLEEIKEAGKEKVESIKEMGETLLGQAKEKQSDLDEEERPDSPKRASGML
jgi:ElaB/YqjD/DUF883 family membrane-anchored ribosome-binding protein